MISRKELSDYSRLLGFNEGQTEKDYLQQLALFLLSKRAAPQLVFKGGTCLQKVFGLNRYSEDLDFTMTGWGASELESLVASISSDIQKWGFENAVARARSLGEKGFNFKFSIKGPLYDGSAKSECSIRLQASVRQSPVLKPVVSVVRPIYSDIMPYQVLHLDVKEMLAEKIAAMFSRSDPKDLFDIHFLLSRGGSVSIGLVNKKLGLYSKSFSVSEFRGRISDMEKSWDQELSELVAKPAVLPSFSDAKRVLLENIKEALSKGG